MRETPDHTDASGIALRSVVRAGIAIAVIVALALAGAYAAWRLWQPADDYQGPNTAFDFKLAPPSLESAPQNAYAVYLAEKERLLHDTQWLDAKAGIARIPIEQAMRILAGGAANFPSASPPAAGAAPASSHAAAPTSTPTNTEPQR
jgi:hypothetical protein